MVHKEPSWGHQIIDDLKIYRTEILFHGYLIVQIEALMGGSKCLTSLSSVTKMKVYIGLGYLLNDT